MKFAILTLVTFLLNTLAVEAHDLDNFTQQQIEQAKQLFTQELASAGSPIVKLAEKVTWPNKALGCPRDDVSYNQVLTDGIKIVLSIEGKDYIYHGDNQGKLFLCDASRSTAPYRTGWQSAEY